MNDDDPQPIVLFSIPVGGFEPAWVQVWGLPDDGIYEWRVVSSAGVVLSRSTDAYSCKTTALRDGLSQWLGDREGQ